MCEHKENIFFELLRVSVGAQHNLSENPSSSLWRELYAMAEKQAVLGVCFAGLSQLVNPSGEDYAGMSMPLYYEWVGTAFQIKKRNELMNCRCLQIQKSLSDAGFQSCILKGQGMASLYRMRDVSTSSSVPELNLLRQSGDIDVWAFGSQNDVISYIRSTGNSGDSDYSHIKYNCFTDTPVEVHYRPSHLPNLFRNARLQKFYREYGMPEKTRRIKLGDMYISVPVSEFNQVFILLHMYKHFLCEGIGFRQLMDYYFVLSEDADMSKAREVIESLGLRKFCGAVMWVLQYVFGLDKRYMLFEPDEKEGLFLLDEVLTGGNFGHYDKRIGELRRGRMSFLWHSLKHNWHLISHYPAELLWQPVWLGYHFIWKRLILT